jgi:hypothetical protein
MYLLDVDKNGAKFGNCFFIIGSGAEKETLKSFFSFPKVLSAFVKNPIRCSVFILNNG